MSHEGKPYAIFRFNSAGLSGKNRQESETVTIKLFRSEQFKSKCSIAKRNFSPPRFGMIGAEYWPGKYRLMINGRWHKENGRRYCFYTIAQASEVYEILSDE